MIRGPVASRVVQQLLLGTEWGELDYLLIDMPPGTGDVHITISQHVVLSGAVVVTTPSMLSHVDVLKGVDMFEKLRVPTLAVVENLAYIDAPPAPRIYPFGEPGAHVRELREKVPSCKGQSVSVPNSSSDWKQALALKGQARCQFKSKI